jgi:hypothetical protein
MTEEATGLSVTPEAIPETVNSEVEETTAPLTAMCECGRGEIEFSCHRCYKQLCVQCKYQEENGSLTYCRNCANILVGVCDVCDALHAKPCRECSKMVCDQHHKRVIERWGWGGRSGQGGVLEWFPMIRTYCQDHGKNRLDRPQPEKRFTGLDGSSPEW